MSALAILAIVVGYVAVAFGCIRPLAGHFAYKTMQRDKRRYPSLHGKDTEPDDWFEAYAGATCLAFVWPLAALIFIGGRFGPKIGAEKEADMERQRKRLRERERELGLEPWE